MLKTFPQDIAVLLCNKGLEKTANVWKMRPFWKLPKMATKDWLCPLENGHFGSKIKNAKKNVVKAFLKDTAVVLCKKGWKNS